jgi:hypothetical protein
MHFNRKQVANLFTDVTHFENEMRSLIDYISVRTVYFSLISPVFLSSPTCYRMIHRGRS